MKTPPFRKSRHNVNLWIIPLRMSLASLGLFAFTCTLDMLAAYHFIHLPNWFTMGGIDDARAILGAMLSCVSTVLALIFSVTLLVLSMVANLFGPRLLYRFVQDWVTQVCIGLFMSAFIFVFLVFLVTHQDEHTSFVPQVSLITSWFVVLGAFGFLVFYSHRVAILIQNPDAIGRIVDDLRKAVYRSYHTPSAAPSELSTSDQLRLERHASDAEAILSWKSGYMQEIDEQRIVDAAALTQALVVFTCRPGQFILQGDTLATVSPSSSSEKELSRSIRDSVTVGRHRVLSQDVEFGLAQIVEIGIRALSPAVNDTFTGIACVDLLAEALLYITEHAHRSGRSFDTGSILRLQVRPLPVPRLVKQAFDQIRQAAADNPAVSIRLLTTIGRLSEKMAAPDGRAALLAQADAVWETATSKSPVTMDLEDLRSAWQTTRTLLLQ